MQSNRSLVRSASAVVVLAIALTTVLSGCGAPPADSSADGSVRVNGSEPQRPLVPANTNETGGGLVVDALFTGVTTLDARGNLHNQLAQSIESTDNITWTITLQPGHHFSNDEPVTSSSFIDAWQYAALLSHGFVDQSAFAGIAGYSAAEDQALSGLNRVNDYVFTVTLVNPAADFPYQLTYHAFAPLPQAFYDNPDSFGERPIGNGPYLLAEDGWKHNERISLVRNPDYHGPDVAQNSAIDIVLYASRDAAYADLLANNLDVLDAIPTGSFNTMQTDLGDRLIRQPAGVSHELAIPESLPHFSGVEGTLRRQAISLAINREEITSVIFQGTRTPARDFTAPVVQGWEPNLSGSAVLGFSPERAQELWDQADALSPWSGAFPIAYNADGGHQAWVDAIANGLNNTLNLSASGAALPTLKDLRAKASSGEIASAYRTSWQGDYPTPANFLEPLYQTNGRGNNFGYSNPAVDELFAAGDRAASVGEGLAAFQRAQEILFEDLPAIPLWNGAVTAGFSSRVDQVTFSWNGVPVLTGIRRTDSK